MAKARADIRSIARSHTESALRTLAQAAACREAPYRTRVDAATQLLNRGYGALIDPTKFEPIRQQFYVYSIHGDDGRLTYIGKGQGYRYLNSAKQHNGWPRIRAEFTDEKEALAFERRLIKRFKPRFNVVFNRAA